MSSRTAGDARRNMEVEVRKARLMVLALTALAIPNHLDAQAGTSSVAYSTANFGSTTIETAGTSALMNVGDAKAQPSASTAPAGVAILGLRQNGVLVTETGVPGTPALTSGRTVAQVHGPIKTAFAIGKTWRAAVVVWSNFTAQHGNYSGDNSFTLSASAHFARSLGEAPCGLTSGLVGTLTYSSSGPIAGTALRTLIT